ncbi:MAG: apolipoprotein N-acyltransferase [Terrimicrobiaceae bacterium]|nr:apolipoprotein N-acyltransferase [Terrimicrobiaceae bacterium]
MKHLWPWLLAALSGALLALAFPPFGHAGFAWFALTPLVAALWFSPRTGRWRPLRLFGLGYVAGLVFFWMSLFWVTEVTRLGWFIFAFYLALFPALWALFTGITCRPRDSSEPSEWLSSSNNLRLAARGAAAWAGIEWMRGTLFTGFGWNALAVALWRNTAIIQIADVTGVAGLSFLIVLVNLTLVLTVKRLLLEAGRVKLRPHFDFTLTMGLVAVAFGYGVYRVNLPRANVAPLRVAAVQANIPQDAKWNPAFERHIIETYRRLSENAAAFRPDLIIWPEAATPRPLLDDEEMLREATNVLAKTQGDFLLGTIRYFLGGAFNAAVLLDQKGGAQVYHKIHLVPFGEYVPLRHTFPLFAWIVGNEVPDDFDAGTEPVVMTLHKMPFRIAPLICFEDTLGDLARRFAQDGAELLVTLTNDGWFRRSAESRQHLANAVFRCAETKLPLVRVANTGVTCFIDGHGDVRQTLDADGSTFVEGILLGEVPIAVRPPKTFYTRYGDLFAMLCCIGALLAVRTHLLTARRPGLSGN